MLTACHLYTHKFCTSISEHNSLQLIFQTHLISSPHLQTTLHQFGYKDATKDCAGCFTEVKANSFSLPPLAHRDRFFYCSRQPGWVRHSQLLIIHAGCFQTPPGPSRGLTQLVGEHARWPSPRWGWLVCTPLHLLRATLEDGLKFQFSQSLLDLCRSPWLFKDNKVALKWHWPVPLDIS